MFVPLSVGPSLFLLLAAVLYRQAGDREGTHEERCSAHDVSQPFALPDCGGKKYVRSIGVTSKTACWTTCIDYGMYLYVWQKREN